MIALTPVFLASGLETAALFQDINHMTIDGNVRAAKIVVEAIEPTLRERARKR